MPDPDLAAWQREFFSERVQRAASGTEGTYFREQVFGALDVLSDALPDVHLALGEQNFRFFVRELLTECQPMDALGTTLIEPFLRFLRNRPELMGDPVLEERIQGAIDALNGARSQHASRPESDRKQNGS